MKTIDIKSLIREDIVNYESYNAVPSAWDMSVAQRIAIEKVDKLDAGENLFGPSSNVTQALSRYTGYQFYPDPEYKELRRVIGHYTGVSDTSIAVGSGGDELIDLILRLVLDPGDTVLNCPPTFSSYALSTILNRGKLVNIPRNEKYDLDISQILSQVDEKVKIIFVCNPNNPTGNVTTNKEIECLLKTGKIVFVDEAYYEFSNCSSIPLLQKYPNLIILRSFSKWAGIAGLRLGYCIMSPYLVEQLMKIKPPYNVNSAASVAGIFSLKDIRYRKRVIKTIKDQRDAMYTSLKRIDEIKIYPSQGNFLFVKLDKKEYKVVKDAFTKANIAVRYYDSSLTGKAIRITIGRPEQNVRMLDIFNTLK